MTVRQIQLILMNPGTLEKRAGFPPFFPGITVYCFDNIFPGLSVLRIWSRAVPFPCLEKSIHCPLLYISSERFWSWIHEKKFWYQIIFSWAEKIGQKCGRLCMSNNPRLLSEKVWFKSAEKSLFYSQSTHNYGGRNDHFGQIVSNCSFSEVKFRLKVYEYLMDFWRATACRLGNGNGLRTGIIGLFCQNIEKKII